MRLTRVLKGGMSSIHQKFGRATIRGEVSDGSTWQLPEPYKSAYEPLETLSYVAAHTQRVRLGTSIINAPFQSPVLLARRFATLDRLSHGRVFAGLGQGWMSQEFAASNVPIQERETLRPPLDPNEVSSFLNIRVADIRACYEQWRSRGAEFLTEPKDHIAEIRCYMRDPDGYLIEIGQTTAPRA